jgi:guanosine-3',5'-bis(diphosphate) 3'-pyrophosphohydrolase
MRLNDILDKVTSYAPNADLDLIMRAYVYSARAHAGQMRKSGEPYLIHPIAVAGILADMRMDVDTIAVGLLHDTMEDCLATGNDLSSQFGSDVAELVDGVTKIGKLEFRNKEEAQAENFRKLVLAMGKDVRVILVKLADRLHNMRTMQHMRPERQRGISQETLEIYAPIANRLGLSRLKGELEDLCFRYLHPEVYQNLDDQLGVEAKERREYIDNTCTILKENLAARGLSIDVKGRPKHLYSVYNKMRDQQLEFEQIHDLLAFRVFTQTLGECYTALGLIHADFRHVPEKLKDYIANPKSNGYQSLHTVVIGPGGQQIEIQIRTHEMHHVAEIGIAAHWRYKEGHLALSRDDVNKVAKLRELFETAREVTDPTEFLETIKVDLFANEIFAFTPRGDVKFFSQGSTVLDFAFAIHTEVGETCTGARVNGRMVPLRYVIRSGDKVEILTRADQTPSRDWLDIAKTGRALSKIRRHIREEERARGREIGRELLENELKKLGFTFNRLLKDGTIKTAAKSLGYRDPEPLYLALAQGHVPVRRFLSEFIPPEKLGADPVEAESANALVTFIKKLRKRNHSPVLISGEEDVLVTYGRCCNPLPGESVMGFITRGRGITVHVANCKQLLSLEPERRIPVQWQREAGGTHSGELQIVCTNQPGMLAEIGSTCKLVGINVTRMEAHTMDDDRAHLTLEVSVTDVDELSALMRSLEKINGIIRVDRLRA